MEEAKIWLERIDEELRSRGMNRSTLSLISGMSEGAISLWFSGKRVPGKRSRDYIERALGLSLAPVGECPDVALQNALFNHPDITHEQAEHEWLTLRMLIDYNKRQRR